MTSRPSSRAKSRPKSRASSRAYSRASSRASSRTNTPHQTRVFQRFFQFYIQLKTYHFSTRIFNRHYNTDTFLKEFAELYDRFVEACMGKHGAPVFRAFQLSIETIDDRNVFQRVQSFRNFLRQIRANEYKNDSDLLNIIDEMDAEIDKYLYLLRLA